MNLYTALLLMYAIFLDCAYTVAIIILLFYVNCGITILGIMKRHAQCNHHYAYTYKLLH